MDSAEATDVDSKQPRYECRQHLPRRTTDFSLLRLPYDVFDGASSNEGAVARGDGEIVSIGFLEVS